MDNNFYDYVIYGSNITSLVLADRLSEISKKILLVNPQNSWGGIFSGINIHNEIFDIGMTNFELDLFGSPEKDIINYSAVPNRKIGNYVHFVEKYLAEFIYTNPIDTPKIAFEGKFFNDLMITNCFDILHSMTKERTDAIKKELSLICSKRNIMHTSLKNHSDDFLTRFNFEDVSLANHGETFHKLFIEPFFNKVLNKKTFEIPAIFHRSGWTPLFYPETLLSQFSRNPQKIKKTIFKYPVSSNFGSFVKSILNKINACSRVDIMNITPDDFFKIDDLNKSVNLGQTTYHFDNFVWCHEPSKLLDPKEIIANDDTKADIDMFFIKINNKNINNFFSVLLDADLNTDFYRCTNQTFCSSSLQKNEFSNIIVEAGGSFSRKKFDEKMLLLNKFLEKILINYNNLEFLEHRSFKNAINIPSVEGFNNFSRVKNFLLDRYKNIDFIGPMSGYCALTLNDQIIQALKFSKISGGRS